MRKIDDGAVTRPGVSPEAGAAASRATPPGRRPSTRRPTGRVERVFDALSPDDVARIATAAGERAEVKMSEEGRPMVLARTVTPWLVYFPWQVGTSNRYRALHFYRVIARPPVFDADVVNRANDALLFGKLVVDEDGDLALTMDVRLDGGVSATWLLRIVEQWRDLIAEVDGRLRLAREDLATLVAAAHVASAKGMLRD